jgi:hypothetical protein
MSEAQQTKAVAAYRFIEFVRNCAHGWVCRNKQHGDYLGHVSYYPRWHQYVFQADPDAVFSADCLADVQHFLKRTDKP